MNLTHSIRGRAKKSGSVLCEGKLVRYAFIKSHHEIVTVTRMCRLMKRQGLKSKGKRKFKAATNSNHGRPVAPNLLDREFIVEQPDSVYAGDITYIQTDEGRFYLAVLIDLYSRAIVGWAMSGQ